LDERPGVAGATTARWGPGRGRGEQDQVDAAGQSD
jgi:hypothetical protein